MRKSGLKSFRDIQVDEQNILTWHGLIVPVSIGLSIMQNTQFFFCFHPINKKKEISIDSFSIICEFLLGKLWFLLTRLNTCLVFDL